MRSTRKNMNHQLRVLSHNGPVVSASFSPTGQAEGTISGCLLFVEAFVVAPQWIERSITTMWAPRVFLNWFVNRMNTIVMSFINHSYCSYWHQLNAILWGPHIFQDLTPASSPPHRPPFFRSSARNMAEEISNGHCWGVAQTKSQIFFLDTTLYI